MKRAIEESCEQHYMYRRAYTARCPLHDHGPGVCTQPVAFSLCGYEYDLCGWCQVWLIVAGRAHTWKLDHLSVKTCLASVS